MKALSEERRTSSHQAHLNQCHQTLCNLFAIALLCMRTDWIEVQRGVRSKGRNKEDEEEKLLSCPISRTWLSPDLSQKERPHCALAADDNPVFTPGSPTTTSTFNLNRTVEVYDLSIIPNCYLEYGVFEWVYRSCVIDAPDCSFTTMPPGMTVKGFEKAIPELFLPTRRKWPWLHGIIYRLSSEGLAGFLVRSRYQGMRVYRNSFRVLKVKCLEVHCQSIMQASHAIKFDKSHRHFPAFEFTPHPVFGCIRDCCPISRSKRSRLIGVGASFEWPTARLPLRYLVCLMITQRYWELR